MIMTVKNKKRTWADHIMHRTANRWTTTNKNCNPEIVNRSQGIQRTR